MFLITRDGRLLNRRITLIKPNTDFYASIGIANDKTWFLVVTSLEDQMLFESPITPKAPKLHTPFKI